MKKKILVCMLTGAFALTLGTSNAYAARANNYVNKSSYRVERPNYVDNNNDGICDNYVERPNCVDDNNDGICDNYVERPNYVDNNNDGICDNIGTQSGCGRRNGHHGKRNR